MMLSIDRQAEKIRRRDRLIRQLYMLVICLGLIVIMLAAMIFAMTRTAAADTICLTKKEARQLWPRQHIYWYSSDHCWSNRRGGPPRGIKIDPIKNSHAEARPILPAPTYDVLPPPRPVNDFADFCCWPILSELDEFLKLSLRDYLRGYVK